MPKSKRNKIVHLTQVKKKGKDHKEDLIKQLNEYVDQYERVFVFDFNETKSDRIMNLRLRLKEHGRIFAGRNSLVLLTLRSIGRRRRTNYASLLGQITGHRGLFFTNLECAKLVGQLEAEQPEFRDKLIGYAQLSATDADSGDSEAKDDDDDDDDDNDDDGVEEGAEDKEPRGRKRITFKMIEKSKTTQKQKQKQRQMKRAAQQPAMET